MAQEVIRVEMRGDRCRWQTTGRKARWSSADGTLRVPGIVTTEVGRRKSVWQRLPEAPASTTALHSGGDNNFNLQAERQRAFAEVVQKKSPACVLIHLSQFLKQLPVEGGVIKAS